jgi:CheY-like chemotaxis protein
MVDRLLFNELIKEALSNLYDVASLETNITLFSILKLPPGFTGNKGGFARQTILSAIDQLRPLRKEETPNSPEWRPYTILYNRYVEGIGIQELSDQLAVSPRQLRRDHHKALQALTEILWTNINPEAADENSLEQTAVPVFEAHDEVIDPIETTVGVYSMLKKQFDSKGVSVKFTPVDMVAPVVTDRVILRQILISLFNNLLHLQCGPIIRVDFNIVDNQAKIEFSAQVGADCDLAELDEDDDLNTVKYWSNRIHARIEENVYAEGKQNWIRRTIWLPHSDQKILLVIDDQEAVINLFKRYLSHTDILTVGVHNSEKALALAHHLKPILITLDVMMPQMDGWELLQLIKLDEKLSDIPVVVCSAWDDPDLSRSLGASGYLKKPITQKMLLEVINGLLHLKI